MKPVMLSFCIAIVPSFVLRKPESRCVISRLRSVGIKGANEGRSGLRLRKETEKGQTIYEVETKMNGKSRDLTFDAGGKLMEVEQEVQMDSIPEPARRAI